MDRSHSFLPLPNVRSSPSTMIARMSLANENAILKLQEEYRQMREKFRHRLLHEQDGVDDDLDTIAFTQELLEKAADMAAFQRYQQEEVVLEAEKELRHAHQDHVLADATQQQAHEESKIAQEELAKLEFFEDLDSGYEDQERLRDLSIAHAASHLEQDAKELSVESQFQEMEASEKKERALEFIRHLEDIEEELKDTLKAVKEYKNDRAMDEWVQREAPKHEHFLRDLSSRFDTMIGDGDLSSGTPSF